MLKGEIFNCKDINTKSRPMLCESLVRNIPLYRLHIIPICKNSIRKLQSFHSECTKIIAQGHYNPGITQTKNETMKRVHNIPTSDSRLEHSRLNLYHRWKHRSAPNCINGKECSTGTCNAWRIRN